MADIKITAANNANVSKEALQKPQKIKRENIPKDFRKSAEQLEHAKKMYEEWNLGYEKKQITEEETEMWEDEYYKTGKFDILGEYDELGRIGETVAARLRARIRADKDAFIFDYGMLSLFNLIHKVGDFKIFQKWLEREADYWIPNIDSFRQQITQENRNEIIQIIKKVDLMRMVSVIYSVRSDPGDLDLKSESLKLSFNERDNTFILIDENGKMNESELQAKLDSTEYIICEPKVVGRDKSTGGIILTFSPKDRYLHLSELANDPEMYYPELYYRP